MSTPRLTPPSQNRSTSGYKLRSLTGRNVSSRPPRPPSNQENLPRPGRLLSDPGHTPRLAILDPPNSVPGATVATPRVWRCGCLQGQATPRKIVESMLAPPFRPRPSGTSCPGHRAGRGPTVRPIIRVHSRMVTPVTPLHLLAKRGPSHTPRLAILDPPNSVPGAHRWRGRVPGDAAVPARCSSILGAKRRAGNRISQCDDSRKRPIWVAPKPSCRGGCTMCSSKNKSSGSG